MFSLCDITTHYFSLERNLISKPENKGIKTGKKVPGGKNHYLTVCPSNKSQLSHLCICNYSECVMLGKNAHWLSQICIIYYVCLRKIGSETRAIFCHHQSQ